MTYFANTLSSRTVAALLTVVFSATMVLGAVGPAYSDAKVHQQIASDNVPSKSAASLA